jgi:hypothetical protein
MTRLRALALRPLVALLVAVVVPAVLAGPAEAAPKEHLLQITSIPPIPGAQFALDGRPLVTDAQGVARVLVPPSSAPHRVELRTPTVTGPDSTSRFVRWHGQDDVEHGYTPVLDGVRIDHRLTLRAAFEQTRSLRFSFVDQAHHPVDVSRISSITLRSDTNRTQRFSGGDAVELVAVHPGSGDGPPVAKDATYSLQSVTIDGTNVVNVGEQRFRPRGDDPVLQVVVLLRSVHLQVKDRLFGRPVPTTVRVVYPDGSTHDLPTDAGGGLVLQNMARGTYTVSALGQAYAIEQKLALSRSQFTDIAVVTYLDLAVVISIALVALLALAWVGVRRTRRHRAAHGGPAPDPAAPDEQVAPGPDEPVEPVAPEPAVPDAPVATR